MKTLLTIAVTAVLLISGSPAQTKPMKWKGFLSDAMCAKTWKGDSGKQKAMGHEASCALHEGCMASGFGVFYRGRFLRFTERTNPIALKYFQTTDQKKRVYVTVIGTMEGDKIEVEKIEKSE